MRILHTLGELRPSGAEVMYRTAAPLWRREGLECDILGLGATRGVYADALEDAGCTVYHIPSCRSAGPVASARHLLAVYRFLRSAKYDIVHTNAEYANFWYLLIARVSGHRNLLRTVHNSFHFGGLLRLERCVQRFLLRRFLGIRMIAVSPSVQETELRCFRNPTTLGGNWFDSGAFHPPTAGQRQDARNALGLPMGTFVVTSVGNCSPVKNHSSILKALHELVQEAPVVYCHAGLEADVPAERELAVDLGIMDKVRFMGYVPNIPLLLRAADVFVMPSLYEGLGIAALEAMAAGVPVVLSRVTGLSELDSSCPGVRWTGTDADSVAAEIRSLLKLSEWQRQEIGARLSAAAHAHFGLQNWASWYARLYKDEGSRPDRGKPEGDRPSSRTARSSRGTFYQG